MKSRYFIHVIVRVILISINCFAFIWLLMNSDRPATQIFAFLLLIAQTVSLINYHNTVMRDLSNFLIFLEENDTTLAFSKKRIERSFGGLISRLDKINAKIQTERIEREKQYNYLQALVKQIDTGIITFDQQGNIGICNPSAREILGIRKLKNISDLFKKFPELSEDKLFGKRAVSSAVKILAEGSEKMLSVKTGAIKIDNQWIRIMSLQNIKPELEAGELDAWRKLIKIQRHEIINSLTPISTLTTAIKRRFIPAGGRKLPAEITAEQISDALNSVEVIEERSKGLIAFMERFKGITEMTGIKPGTIHVLSLFDNVNTLFTRELEEKRVVLEKQVVPESLTLYGDSRLLEQVLINLVKNSIEAINHAKGRIQLKAFKSPAQVIIQATDNGCGIKREALESIFVPSYTTKESGSGIGLSISRQIIQLHNGSIEVKSIPGVETTFEIVIPQ